MADRILVSTSEMEATIQKYENARNELQDAYSSSTRPRAIWTTATRAPRIWRFASNGRIFT